MERPILKLMWMVLGTAALLGLAVLGRGGFADFFCHPALVALVVVAFALTVAAFFAGRNLSAGVREDRGNRWVLPVFFVIGLLAGYFPAYADREGFWIIDGDTVRCLGVALFAAGGALRLWPASCSGIGSAGWSPSSPDTRW